MEELFRFLEIGGLVFLGFIVFGMRARLRRMERKITLMMRYMQVDINQPITLSMPVRELAVGGRTGEAIRAHRKETGVSRREAKASVEAFLAETQKMGT